MQHMTMKQFNKSNSIAIGYCGAYYLVQGATKIGYNAGIYGWNCDIYMTYDSDFNPVYITTGYRNTRGYSPKYECIKFFNERAESALHDYSVPYEKRMENIKHILSQFIDTVINGDDIEF